MAFKGLKIYIRHSALRVPSHQVCGPMHKFILLLECLSSWKIPSHPSSFPYLYQWYPQDFNPWGWLSDDTESLMPLKDDFYYLHFLRGGGSTGGSTKFNQEAGGGKENAWPTAWLCFPWERQGRGNRLGLASLNTMVKPWATGVISSCLYLSLALFQGRGILPPEK